MAWKLPTRPHFLTVSLPLDSASLGTLHLTHGLWRALKIRPRAPHNKLPQNLSTYDVRKFVISLSFWGQELFRSSLGEWLWQALSKSTVGCGPGLIHLKADVVDISVFKMTHSRKCHIGRRPQFLAMGELHRAALVSPQWQLASPELVIQERKAETTVFHDLVSEATLSFLQYGINYRARPTCLRGELHRSDC